MAVFVFYLEILNSKAQISELKLLHLSLYVKISFKTFCVASLAVHCICYVKHPRRSYNGDKWNSYPNNREQAMKKILNPLNKKKDRKTKIVVPTNTSSHISNFCLTPFEPVDLAILSNHKFLLELWLRDILGQNINLSLFSSRETNLKGYN